METSVNNVYSYSPLLLAYMGDAVIELIARESIIKNGDVRFSDMSDKVKKYVTAVNQSAASVKAAKYFTETESEVFRRGKNAKNFNTPKNARISEYHRATGLEAVFGYLYLNGEMKRARDLFTLCFDEGNTSDEAGADGNSKQSL